MRWETCRTPSFNRMVGWGYNLSSSLVKILFLLRSTLQSGSHFHYTHTVWRTRRVQHHSRGSYDPRIIWRCSKDSRNMWGSCDHPPRTWISYTLDPCNIHLQVLYIIIIDYVIWDHRARTVLHVWWVPIWGGRRRDNIRRCRGNLCCGSRRGRESSTMSRIWNYPFRWPRWFWILYVVHAQWDSKDPFPHVHHFRYIQFVYLHLSWISFSMLVLRPQSLQSFQSWIEGSIHPFCDCIPHNEHSIHMRNPSSSSLYRNPSIIYNLLSWPWSIIRSSFMTVYNMHYLEPHHATWLMLCWNSV